MQISQELLPILKDYKVKLTKISDYSLKKNKISLAD